MFGSALAYGLGKIKSTQLHSYQMYAGAYLSQLLLT
jgi:hypothetical protein